MGQQGLEGVGLGEGGPPPPSTPRPSPAGFPFTFGPWRPTFPGVPWKRTEVLARRAEPGLERGALSRGPAPCLGAARPHYLRAWASVVPLLSFDPWQTLEWK